MAAPLLPLDELIPWIAHAITKWRGQHTEETIERTVHAELDKNAKQIVMKLLGFDVKYNQEYELDHCNGRAGDSAAGDYLRKANERAVVSWLDSVPLPVLTVKDKATIQRSMKEAYRSQIHSEAFRLVQAAATQDANELIKCITSAQTVENHGKLLALIHDKHYEG